MIADPKVDELVLKDGSRVPMKHAKIIKRNFAAHKHWSVCSPLFKVTREQVAEIVLAKIPNTNWFTK